MLFILSISVLVNIFGFMNESVSYAFAYCLSVENEHYYYYYYYYYYWIRQKMSASVEKININGSVETDPLKIATEFKSLFTRVRKQI
jgi:hypothetical protein